MGNNQIYDLIYKLIENDVKNLIEQCLRTQNTFA